MNFFSFFVFFQKKHNKEKKLNKKKKKFAICIYPNKAKYKIFFLRIKFAFRNYLKSQQNHGSHLKRKQKENLRISPKRRSSRFEKSSHLFPKLPHLFFLSQNKRLNFIQDFSNTPHIDTQVPNLQVWMVMRSLHSKGIVELVFNWSIFK